MCVYVCVCALYIITTRTLLPNTAPAPRLSGTPGEVKETVEVVPGLHSREILQELGYLKEVCSESLTVCMYQRSLKSYEEYMYWLLRGFLLHIVFVGRGMRVHR